MGNELHCDKCGATMPDDATNCPECGERPSFQKGELRSNVLQALVISIVIFLIDSATFHPLLLVYVGLYLYFRPPFLLFSKKVAIGLTVASVLLLFITSKPPLSQIVMLSVPVIAIARILYLAMTRSFSRVQIKGLARVGIYLLLFVSILVLFNINQKVARSRGEMLVAACESYKQDRGDYPDKLDDLVPEYIDKVPYTRYTLGREKFRYWSREGSTVLEYTDLPPFGRPYYSFDRHEWRYMD